MELQVRTAAEIREWNALCDAMSLPERRIDPQTAQHERRARAALAAWNLVQAGTPLERLGYVLPDGTYPAQKLIEMQIIAGEINRGRDS